MMELSLSHVDNNATINANAGDIVVITLPENATTGYQWDIASLTQDTLTLERVERTAASSENLGVGGNQAVFRFELISPGRGNLSLKLWRGFESDDSVTMFKVDLNISVQEIGPSS